MILLPPERSEWWAPQGLTCFTCGRDAGPDEVLVSWIGPEHNIVLHAGCAERLGVALIADSREALLAGARWENRATRVAVHAISRRQGAS